MRKEAKEVDVFSTIWLTANPEGRRNQRHNPPRISYARVPTVWYSWKSSSFLFGSHNSNEDHTRKCAGGLVYTSRINFLHIIACCQQTPHFSCSPPHELGFIVAFTNKTEQTFSNLPRAWAGSSRWHFRLP